MDFAYPAGIPRGSSERFHAYESPSFSSTLLDAIYRSFDESDTTNNNNNNNNLHRPSSRSRSQSILRAHPPSSSFPYRKPRESDDLVARRRSLPPESTADYYPGIRSSVLANDHRRRSLGSATTSSSSSSAGSDFFYRRRSPGNLKPIRTSGSGSGAEGYPRPPSSSSSASAKSRAMKLYGDLKRMKQPISPGGKLASFLNSLFSTSKKQKTSSESNFSTASTTPSCLSKRPSSAGRYEKRSVRFCPVTVPPRGGEELKARVMEKNRRVEEMARDILRNYRQREETMIDGDGDVDGDDDVESCCSSDLFELEIGVDRYCAELPVYETTRVETNRAIASGIIA